MANEILSKKKTALSFTNATTPALTLASLGAGAGRVGATKDLGADIFPRWWRWRLKTEFAVAPTEGKVIEIYLATSDGTIRDGGAGATDAALANVLDRHQMQFIGVMYCRSTTSTQYASGIFEMLTRHFSPVVFNGGDQALSSTAGDHELILEPYADEVQ